jgi:DNA-binding transcriptional regulator LsrR (DeoR family)
VKVFVEGSTAEGVALEQTLKAQYKLQYCTVGPSDIDGVRPGGESVIPSLGSAGALYLQQYLEQHPKCSIGVGHGRTLAALANALPRMARPHVRFVSILGSLTRRATANPFDVIYRFAERTGGEGYFVPAPLFVDSIEDADILRGQRVVKSVLDLAHRTDLILVGIGNLRNTPAIYAAERKALAAEGIVGEMLGQFLDREGRIVNCSMGQRSIGLRLDALRGRAVVGVAGGTDKSAAIHAALRSGLLSGLITDETTARGILGASAPRGASTTRRRGTRQ